jgi:hypothetical protein
MAYLWASSRWANFLSSQRALLLSFEVKGGGSHNPPTLVRRPKMRLISSLKNDSTTNERRPGGSGQTILALGIRCTAKVQLAVEWSLSLEHRKWGLQIMTHMQAERAWVALEW